MIMTKEEINYLVVSFPDKTIEINGHVIRTDIPMFNTTPTDTWVLVWKNGAGHFERRDESGSKARVDVVSFDDQVLPYFLIFVDCYNKEMEKRKAAQEAANQKTWDQIRRARDILLMESDFTQVVLSDITIHPDVKEQYAEYRQKLRDITDDYVDPNEVVWPTKPGMLYV